MNSPIGEIKVFCANANRQMAATIARHLHTDLGLSDVSRFSDGEINMRVNETVRGSDVFIIQSTSHPVNDHLMELLIMIDAMKRSSAGRITAVMPYFGYARQDRKARSHDPISAKLVANLLTTAGASRILTMDLHCPQIQGFFDIPVDHLRGVFIFVDYIKNAFGDLNDVVVVSPDLGSVARSNSFAEMLDVPLAIVDKRRNPQVADKAVVANFIGDVKGKIAIMLDDVIATGGSLCNAAATVMEHGAKAVYACVTHPVLSGNAVELIANSQLERLICLDTIEVPAAKRHPKIEILSVGPFLAAAIDRIHNHKSIGGLFKMDIRYQQIPLL
ncbi:MAG: ribose-phosphate pyrophosphokinase [Defluviitaleaceae bacterium]|nr:ribose-phosphate pyrophosphokinase [Defluviitaleaceae bacterium]